MTKDQAIREIKKHCIAIAAIIEDLKKDGYPEADDIRCSLTVDSDGYGTFGLTVINGRHFKNFASMYSIDMLREPWNEHDGELEGEFIHKEDGGNE